jgi:hypothetical protein
MWFLVLMVCGGLHGQICSQAVMPAPFATRKDCIYAGAANTNETGAIGGSVCIKHDSGISVPSPTGQAFVRRFSADGTNDEPAGDGK